MTFSMSWTANIRLPRAAALLLALTLPTLGDGARLEAQAPERIDLTLERLVELTLSNSYQVRFLNMGVDQTRLRLQAERARLRSSVSLNVSAPDFQQISESRWNSNLGLNEIVQENSRRWEAQLSIRQPVILFGYPTNGYLSLNNRMYRYTQLESDGERDLTYYNRYFVQYTQPLFQPNGLKNSLERAGLNLDRAEMEFYGDVMEVVVDASEEHLDLFESAYEQRIWSDYVARLELTLQAAQDRANADPSRAIDLDQVRVELANARERLTSMQSGLRRSLASLKTGLKLPESTEIVISSDMPAMRPVQVNAEQAIRFARELTPRLRGLDIQRRENQIGLEETKGRGAFRMDLEFTYGREMRDEILGDLWGEPRNTYTVDVNASVPIWDWGERRARVEAQRISLDRNELQFEQAEAGIVTNVRNEIANVEDLQNRVLAMQDNLALASGISQQSLERYRAGAITALDLLQSLRRENDTANNFLDAYVGWRESIRRLQEMTYYDFETGQPVLQRFGIDMTNGGTTR